LGRTTQVSDIRIFDDQARLSCVCRFTGCGCPADVIERQAPSAGIQALACLAERERTKMPIVAPRRLSLHSERLLLAPGELTDAIEIYELMLSNHAYFSYWNPVIDRSSLSAEYVLQLIESERLAWERGESLRFWIRLRQAPSTLIGWVKIDALTGGAFHSGRVGYAIAQAHHRQGYMERLWQRPSAGCLHRR
jgi:RimJ/RimL family protein N-acetyltransferase